MKENSVLNMVIKDCVTSNETDENVKAHNYLEFPSAKDDKENNLACREECDENLQMAMDDELRPLKTENL